MVFVPFESVPAGHHLYMMHRGVAIRQGRPLASGSAWGADMVLAKRELRSTHCAMALMSATAALRPLL